MTPHSRGTPPVEFTVRVVCLLGMQFGFDSVSHSQDFTFYGQSCHAKFEGSELLIEAKGLPTLEIAQDFYGQLQTQLAYLALSERLAMTIPFELNKPRKALFSFMAGDAPCMARGWPYEEIQPEIISRQGASVYAEHEFIVIDGTFRFVPRFQFPVSKFIAKLEGSVFPPELAPLGEELLLAITMYADAARSTSWVSSFLSLVSILEMLAPEQQSSQETQEAVIKLIQQAKKEFASCDPVDLKRMCECLQLAKKISKGVAIRNLVLKYCSPNSATAPSPPIFVSEQDCIHKVKEMYNVRSTYTHEGRVVNPKKFKNSFYEIRETTLKCVAHILQCQLDKRSTDTMP
jgi:hypothetical protein